MGKTAQHDRGWVGAASSGVEIQKPGAFSSSVQSSVMGADRYYLELAAAFVRGKLSGDPRFAASLFHCSDEEAVEAGLGAGLRLHKFKRNIELPRVRRVIGILRGIAPASILDVGSGRGTFLWPLLDQFPGLPVTAVDRSPIRVADIHAVRRGGIDYLSTTLADATALGFKRGSFDVVTVLEVLEHIPDTTKAIAEAMRVAERFVIASMPSKEDSNPEHIHLFDKDKVREAFTKAGAAKVTIEYVPGHMIVLAKAKE